MNNVSYDEISFSNYKLAKFAYSVVKNGGYPHKKIIFDVYWDFLKKKGLNHAKWLFDSVMSYGISSMKVHCSGKEAMTFEECQLFDYANKTCHMLTGSERRAPVAICFDDKTDDLYSYFTQANDIEEELQKKHIDIEYVTTSTLKSSYTIV